MDRIAEYIQSVAAAALFCGLIDGIFKKNSTYRCLVKIFSGLLMVTTMISPFIQARTLDISDYINEFDIDGQKYVASGVTEMQEEKRSFIKSEAEAYIIDKALSVEANIDAEIQIAEDEPYVPISVTVEGQISPYKKQVIAECISTDLGIPKENQIWK